MSKAEDWASSLPLQKLQLQQENHQKSKSTVSEDNAKEFDFSLDSPEISMLALKIGNGYSQDT